MCVAGFVRLDQGSGTDLDSSLVLLLQCLSSHLSAFTHPQLSLWHVGNSGRV